MTFSNPPCVVSYLAGNGYIDGWAQSCNFVQVRNKRGCSGTTVTVTGSWGATSSAANGCGYQIANEIRGKNGTTTSGWIDV